MKPHRVSAPEQKKLAGDERLLRAWRAWHRQERDAALAGPHGAMSAEAFRMFENLRFVQPAQLIGFVRSIDWTVIDYGVRLVVVHEVNVAITKVREQHGLPPFDDGLSNELKTPFQIVRARLLSPPCEAPSGAQPGFEEPIAKHQEHLP
jgi:hypothetical protein